MIALSILHLILLPNAGLSSSFHYPHLDHMPKAVRVAERRQEPEADEEMRVREG